MLQTEHDAGVVRVNEDEQVGAGVVAGDGYALLLLATVDDQLVSRTFSGTYGLTTIERRRARSAGLVLTKGPFVVVSNAPPSGSSAVLSRSRSMDWPAHLATTSWPAYGRRLPRPLASCEVLFALPVAVQELP